MEKVYMVSDWSKGPVDRGVEHLGIEHLGDIKGRILKEDGTEIGWHHSSTIGWLREDLKSKLDNPENYEIIDLIGQEVPEKFKISE